MKELSTSSSTIYFSPKSITRFLLWSVFFLLLGHIAAFIEDYVRHAYSRTAKNIIKWFDFNLENNVPTWFSVIILAFSAILLFIIYRHQKKQQVKNAFYWLVLSIIFIFLSIDESVQVHEEVARMLRPSVGDSMNGFLYWAWVVPYSVFVVVAGVFFLRFVLSLPPVIRNQFFIGGAMFITGALLLEFPEGYFYKVYGLDHIYNRILYCIEELFEMCGVIIFINALLGYMRDNKIGISISAE